MKLLGCVPKRLRNKVHTEKPTLPKTTSKSAENTPNQPDQDAALITSILPGSNAYDRVVAATSFTYSDAKVREEVNLVNEKMAQAKIATQAAQLALDKEKLALQKEREQVITREEYLLRQEIVVSSFLELLRLTIIDCAAKVPQTDRESLIEEVTHRSRQALAELAVAVTKKQSLAEVHQIMSDAFRVPE